MLMLSAVLQQVVRLQLCQMLLLVPEVVVDTEAVVMVLADRVVSEVV
jgi:hypothetical protein